MCLIWDHAKNGVFIDFLCVLVNKSEVNKIYTNPVEKSVRKLLNPALNY